MFCILFTIRLIHINLQSINFYFNRKTNMIMFFFQGYFNFFKKKIGCLYVCYSYFGFDILYLDNTKN